MFSFTVSKPGLRQAAALVLCAACMTGTVAAAVHFAGGGAVVTAAASPGTIETTQDIGSYFSGFGYEVDLTTAAVDKVRIPKKWDDSFAAFDQVVGESGGSLARYKGKTVEKWTVLCPARSNGDEDCYGVLLVYKARALGGYLLGKPSGEVRGLVSAARAEADAAAPGRTQDAAQAPGADAAEKTADAADAAVKTAAAADAAGDTAQVSADAGQPAADWPTE